MRIWIAKDWYATMVFTTKPKLLPSYCSEVEKEWYGHRESYLEQFVPKEIYKEVKMNKCLECNLDVNIKIIKQL